MESTTKRIEPHYNLVTKFPIYIPTTSRTPFNPTPRRQSTPTWSPRTTTLRPFNLRTTKITINEKGERCITSNVEFSNVKYTHCIPTTKNSRATTSEVYNPIGTDVDDDIFS